MDTNRDECPSWRGERNLEQRDYASLAIRVNSCPFVVDRQDRHLPWPNVKLTDDEARAKGGRPGTMASPRSSSFGRACCSLFPPEKSGEESCLRWFRIRENPFIAMTS